MSGKRKFDSHERALTRAGKILTAGRTKTEALGAYRCGFCNHYHLTSKV